jgi:2',3'-cyclic-nucleotide 2'-phosphodiesterase/3'-nucleotidase
MLDAARITLLGTTDIHGNVLDWDYYTDTPYSDAAGNHVGLAKISTLVAGVRAARGACSTVLLDAGDTIQGTPLAYYAARLDPARLGSAPLDPGAAAVHPVAGAMNTIGYDAAALGNHEFNYGIDVLNRFRSELNHPLLAANALQWGTDEPAFEEFVIKHVPVGPPGAHVGHERGHDHGDEQDTVGVGIVGLVTPGCAIWDKPVLDGRISFTGIVEQAAAVIPRVRAAGAEVVVVCCHSGLGPSSSYGEALPWPENASAMLAEEVPGIDVILVGHAHVEIPQRFVINTVTGSPVLLSEPLKWAMRLSVIDLDLHRGPQGRWQVARSQAVLLDAGTATEDPEIVRVVAAAHEATRRYVNSPIGTSRAAMSAATSRWQASAVIDFVNHVQAEAVTTALAGTEWADLPVLSIAAPFNAQAAIPAGTVSVRDVAALYSFDNTLEAIVLTGSQLTAYLEHSAAYFQQVRGTGPFAPAELTNAPRATAPAGTPDYNYDIIGGLGAGTATRLAYDIDIARPAGARISNLNYGGAPVTATDRFVVAINNYRASGGGNFPGVTAAQVVYDAQVEIRQLLIDWVTAAGTIDPDSFCGADWRLVADGRPISVLQR